MKVTDVKPGEYISRDNWGTTKQLAITRNEHFNLVYVNTRRQTGHSIVRNNSSAYEYNDFYLSDKYGNKLPKQKETQMKQEEINFIVTNNKTTEIKVFKEAIDRDDYIADMLDKHSRIRFYIFEPTMKVEPKAFNLSELFQKIIKWVH